MNELFSNTGMATTIGLMVTGAVLYMLRAVPVHLFQLAQWSFTVRLTVGGDDEVFDHISEWLSEHTYAKRARTLKLSTGRSGADRWTLAPGFGTHFFWDKGLVILNRSVDEKAGSNGWQIRPKERMTITILGRKQGRLRTMIEAAYDKRASQEAVGVRVWTSGWWARLHSKGKRSLDTVFLPPEQKKNLVDNVRWFLENRGWFASRGIPYRYGIMLYGPPGTGKTTTVMALSSYFNRPIYILNLATVSNDNELMQAFMAVGKGAILLIEDVDAAGTTTENREETPANPSALTPPPAARVTLSGLLNAIDGVAAAEDRILVMTTNHPEKLDPALVRKSRIDASYEIGYLAPSEVTEMARAFFPDRDPAQVVAGIAFEGPRPASEWQSVFMTMALQKI